MGDITENKVYLVLQHGLRAHSVQDLARQARNKGLRCDLLRVLVDYKGAHRRRPHCTEYVCLQVRPTSARLLRWPPTPRQVRENEAARQWQERNSFEGAMREAKRLIEFLES